MYCRNCGKEIDEKAVVCPHCGVDQRSTYRSVQNASKSRLLIGLVGIFFGTLGIHNFILGHTSRGVTQLLLTVLGSWFSFGLTALAVFIWSIVESIQILTGEVTHDAHGNPLTD